MNEYLNVLLESAWVASVIPGGTEPTFFAMKSFTNEGMGGYSMPLACVCAVAGATIGQFFNYVVGTFIAKRAAATGQNVSGTLLKMRGFFVKYGVFVLLVSWMPLFNLFVVLAGMVKIPLRLALPLIVAGLVVAYGYHLI